MEKKNISMTISACDREPMGCNQLATTLGERPNEEIQGKALDSQ